MDEPGEGFFHRDYGRPAAQTQQDRSAVVSAGKVWDEQPHAA